MADKMADGFASGESGAGGDVPGTGQIWIWSKHEYGFVLVFGIHVTD